MWRKKPTNEDVGKFIEDTVEQIRSEMWRDFVIAQNDMKFAKQDFLDSLDEKQKALFYKYQEKKEEFLRIAGEYYKIDNNHT